jgi:hypothetical protein
VREVLWTVAREVRQQGKLAIFLFNEVDGLVKHNPSLIQIWRGMNDEGLARFLMVGYSVIGRLGIPNSPFFHFTEGTHFVGDKAVALTALSPAAAESLLDLLHTSELGLDWRSEAEQKHAYALLLERSYRIPWVLQRYGQLLVQHLERRRSSIITWEDVNTVLSQGQEGNVVWQYINDIDYKSLGYREVQRAVRPGFQLILFTLARKRYFLGGHKR